MKIPELTEFLVLCTYYLKVSTDIK